MIDKVFPEKMKSARLAQELSFDDLAIKTKLTAKYLRDIESGRRIGSILSLVSIAKNLGLSLDDIYGL